jgi:leucyl aminopeptidase
VDEVIDIATLTGACMVALGTAASGIMGNNEEFISKIIETGKVSGEKFWELPMWQEYRDNMNSDVADMKNTGTRYGGASAAGMFLKEFVTDDVKWAHLDVAGTAFLESPHKEFGKGATGVGVRTILNYILCH